ncbi:MAG: Sir2 family NAD-dependent protein deacetylase [Planctomycetota bacterium]|jgi:NAD-dependent deacetylase
MTVSQADDRSGLLAAAAALGNCQRLLVLTGAGTSADAGVPTFRDAGGLWRDHRPEDLASRQAFADRPEVVWEWYRQRRLHIAGCEPHAGQRCLALLQRHFPGQVLIATTNEDDLLERAGVSPVLHLHGSLFTSRCANDCGWSTTNDQDNAWSFVPCPRCGAPVRPGSVWFGEPLPPAPLAAIEAFRPDGCLVVGSSSLVQPAAAIPPELALAGRPVVEINPQATPLSGMIDHALFGTARALLPDLVDLLTSRLVRSVSDHG